MFDGVGVRALDYVDDTLYALRLRRRCLLARVAGATVGRSAFGVSRWNIDKPHRCPQCHAVTVDDRRPTWREVYRCCRCGTRFARWPMLSPVLPDRGVVCTEHRAGSLPVDGG